MFRSLTYYVVLPISQYAGDEWLLVVRVAVASKAEQVELLNSQGFPHQMWALLFGALEDGCGSEQFAWV